MSEHHPTRIHVKCTYSSFQKCFRMYFKYKVHTIDIKMRVYLKPRLDVPYGLCTNVGEECW